MIRAFLLAFILALAPAAGAQVPVPPLTGPVVDLTGTLTPEQQRALDAQLREFAKRKGSQIVVLLVPTTRPEAIEPFAIRVAEAWKIGRKGTDDGVIVVVAKDDRELRIEVGYGLEGAIPDITARRIIDEYMVPRFKAGDFNGGITAAVSTLMKLIEGEKLPPPQPQQEWRRGGGFDGNTIFMLFIAAIVGGGILRAIFGRLLGAGIVGGALGVGGWLLAGSLMVGVIAAAVGFFFTLMGGMRPGYYGGRGGGFGGGFGGSSGGGGGFSGGGGSFGGGGASGRW